MIPKDLKNLITAYVWSREMWILKQKVHVELRSFFVRKWFTYHLHVLMTHLLPPNPF